MLLARWSMMYPRRVWECLVQLRERRARLQRLNKLLGSDRLVQVCPSALNARGAAGFCRGRSLVSGHDDIATLHMVVAPRATPATRAPRVMGVGAPLGGGWAGGRVPVCWEKV